MTQQHIENLAPHQQRVVGERADLADKLDKLGVFLGGSVFNELPEDERDRLTRQHAAMSSYLNVLDERIGAFVTAG